MTLIHFFHHSCTRACLCWKPQELNKNVAAFPLHAIINGNFMWAEALAKTFANSQRNEGGGGERESELKPNIIKARHTTWAPDTFPQRCPRLLQVWWFTPEGAGQMVVNTSSCLANGSPKYLLLCIWEGSLRDSGVLHNPHNCLTLQRQELYVLSWLPNSAVLLSSVALS